MHISQIASSNSATELFSNTTFGNSQSSFAKYDSIRNICPQNCDETGSEPVSWTAYHKGANILSKCNETMLLDFVLYTPLDDPSKQTSIRSCAANFDGSNKRLNYSCPSSSYSSSHTSSIYDGSMQLAWTGPNNSTFSPNAVAAVQQIERYLSQPSASCGEEAISFAVSGNVVIGLYAGSGIRSQNLVTPILEQLIQRIETNGLPETLVAQLCATKGQSSRPCNGTGECAGMEKR
ncbi:hypothetical protein UA08_06139 [Talaromyces atroroseus]|uniref:Uncharacterized protein n=1 Tax=Talaromyces atroroseus TaxID=1441469 RepID=A0A225AC54_TALAT|nr:hypothetical protein UA08_06139 [Talaromyces atroroseus]OKL58642.1 hypothetical protein UA08_06139 [Talaromyces atroroseus]